MSQNLFVNRGNWQPRSQVTALIVLAVIIGLIFAGVYLSQVATYASTVREVETFITQRDRLERTNEQLRAQIASLQTAPRLQARAVELGFRPATAADIEYLVVDGYNPNRSRTVVQLQTSADEFDAAFTYDETFSGWLQQQWDSLTRQFQRFGSR